nr:DUF3016 domain-containing protein [Pseudoduganella dura]
MLRGWLVNKEIAPYARYGINWSITTALSVVPISSSMLKAIARRGPSQVPTEQYKINQIVKAGFFKTAYSYRNGLVEATTEKGSMMTNLIRKLALTSLLALGAGGVCAEVVVNYVQPERFSDFPSDQRDRDRALRELTKHFGKLGAELPPGQTLRIDIKDVDMAGREIPRRSVSSLRTYSSLDWPRIELQFEIESSGQTVHSGEVTLRDMGFSNRANRYYNGDVLRFEKQMLDEWFYATVLPSERSARR